LSDWNYNRIKLTESQLEEFPHYDDNGWVLEHRYIWWKHNNRKIPEDKDIHHINGDPSDNRIENLELV
jgi:hypothetical protein